MWWAVAAFLWISTGLARVFMETEKPTEYYMHNWLFHTKMTLLLIILVLEVRPIVRDQPLAGPHSKAAGNRHSRRGQHGNNKLRAARSGDTDGNCSNRDGARRWNFWVTPVSTKS
jgi:hypothetical protein